MLSVNPGPFSCQTWFVHKYGGVRTDGCLSLTSVYDETFCGGADVSTRVQRTRGPVEKTALIGCVPARSAAGKRALAPNGTQSEWISETLQLKCFHFQQSHLGYNSTVKCLK